MEKLSFKIFFDQTTFSEEFERYIMTLPNNTVLAEITVSTQQSGTTKHISIESNTKISSKTVLKDLTEDKIEVALNEIGDSRLTTYFQYIFQKIFDENIKYSRLAKDAKKIRENNKISRDLAMLLSMIKDTALRERVINDLSCANIERLTEEQIKTLHMGSNKKKKKLIALLISPESFKALDVKKRGRTYIASIINQLLCQ